MFLSAPLTSSSAASKQGGRSSAVSLALVVEMQCREAGKGFSAEGIPSPVPETEIVQY